MDGVDGVALRAPGSLYQRYVVVGLGATALVLIALPLVIFFGHLPVTWMEIDAELGSALVVMVVAALLPWRTLAQRRSGQAVLYTWSLFDVALVGAAIASTGGQRSWFWAVFVLTTIFFSVGYPPPGQLALLGATLASLAAASASGHSLSIANLCWQMAIIVATFGLASFPVAEMRRQTAEQRRAREEASRLATRLAEREEWWRSLIERTNDPIVVFDRQWQVQFASPAYEGMLGYSAADVEGMHDGMTLVGMVHPDDMTQVREGARAAAEGLVSSGRSTGRITCRLKTKDGDWRVVELAFAEVPGTGFVANFHDVTDRVAAEAALSHQATHDALTGLGNRSAFYEALRGCLAVAARRRGTLSVLMLDLESFKVINDTVGHAVGDQLLIEVARRLSSTLRAADIVARLGGDEFSAVLTTGGDPDGAKSASERVLRALDEPVVLGGRPFWLRASIGVSCYPSHGRSPEELVRQADRAMYDAKRTGSGVTLYEPAMEANGTSQVGLLGELRRAIPEGELRLHFQPKVSVRTGDVIGLETLIRWQHPQRGILTPAAFLPVAEASGLVRAVSAWVMPTALRQLNRWMSQGLDVSVAVNVSAQDLADDGFPAQVGRWLDESRVPADRLVVELTEASAISDTERGTGALAGLRALGARVSLDDFGSGYSSLAYLAQLPLDEVKLDRAFLTSSLDPDGFMLRSVVDIGHHLGLSVVAEGVESVETYRRLASFGCDSVQGYVCAQPMPAEEVAAFVAGWQSEAWAAAGGQAATVSAVGGARVVRRMPPHRSTARRG